MFHLSMKGMTHQLHMPHEHRVASWMARMVHDDRFWALALAIFLVVVLIGLTIFLTPPSGTETTIMPWAPFDPYTPGFPFQP